MNYNDTEFFYITNLQNDVIKLVDATRDTVVEYKYNAWGEIIYTWNDSSLGYNLSSINPYRYRSYRWDSELNLYYLQSRYYNPQIGQFLKADGFKYLDPSSTNGLNLYVYCNNNPVMYSDSTGHSAEWWEWAISGAQGALGVGLMFVPGAQVFGVGLIVSGGSMLASNTMSAMGLDDKLSMQVQSGLNVVAGIGLSFVPVMGGIGQV